MVDGLRGRKGARPAHLCLREIHDERNRKPSIERSALIGFAVGGLAWALLVVPAIENTGFVLGLLLLFTLALYPPSRSPSSRGKVETMNDIESEPSILSTGTR